MLEQADGVPNEQLVTTYPRRWIKKYFERDYFEVDPIIRQSTKSVLPINWCDVKPESPEEYDFLCDARAHGVGSAGITVALHTPAGSRALLSLTADDTAACWARRMKQIAADVTYATCIMYNSQRSRSKPALTQREREVLTWAAKGKSAWETGQILGISQRTVEFHVRNTCGKLKVVSKTQAVSMAVSNSLI